MLGKNGKWKGWKPLTAKELTEVERSMRSCSDLYPQEVMHPADNIYRLTGVLPGVGDVIQARLCATLRKREALILALIAEITSPKAAPPPGPPR